jgi:hypothetical protein
MSETLKPWLFLDVDGVIIPGGVIYPIDSLVADAQPADTIAIDVQPASHMPPCRAFVPHAIAARLVQLSEAFDIVWCTTWAAAASQLHEKLGIAPEHCLVPRQRFRGPSLKGEAATDFLMGYDTDQSFEDDGPQPETDRWRPFAWADDQLGSVVNITDAVSLAKKKDIPWLGIVPSEQTGLTAAHTAALLAFAAELAGEVA